MPPAPLVLTSESDKENSPLASGRTPVKGGASGRLKTAEPAGRGENPKLPLTPSTGQRQKQAVRTPPTTASVMMDSHWAGAAGSPHPVTAKLADADSPNFSPSGRVRLLAAQIEAAASPPAQPAPAGGLPSPVTSCTPRLFAAPSLRAHPLGVSMLMEDAAPEMASTQLSALGLSPLPEEEGAASPDAAPTPAPARTTASAAAGPDAPGAPPPHEEAGCNTEPPPAADAATSCELPLPKTPLADAACNTEAEAVRSPARTGVSVGVSADLPPAAATPAAPAEGEQQGAASLSVKMPPTPGTVDLAGEVAVELLQEVERLRSKLEESEAKLAESRKELKAERRKSAASSVPTPSPKPAPIADTKPALSAAASGPSGGAAASPFSGLALTPGMAGSPYDPYALTHTVGRLRMAIQRQAQDHAELAEFAEAERSVIEVAEAELEEALQKERGRLRAMQRRMESMRREATGTLAKEQELRIELEASLRASDKQRKLLQSQMDDMRRGQDYSPDKLEAALANLRKAEAELGAVQKANEAMLSDLVSVYGQLQRHSGQLQRLVGAPMVGKMMGQLQRWEKLAAAQEGALS